MTNYKQEENSIGRMLELFVQNCEPTDEQQKKKFDRKLNRYKKTIKWKIKWSEFKDKIHIFYWSIRCKTYKVRKKIFKSNEWN